jgi:hypothetical protein
VIEARAVPFLGGQAVVVGSEKIAKEKNGEFPKASTDGPEYFASCFLELLDGCRICALAPAESKEIG